MLENVSESLPGYNDYKTSKAPQDSASANWNLCENYHHDNAKEKKFSWEEE